MKKVFVLLLVILVFMLKAFSQNMDTLQQGPTCFKIVHASPNASAKNVSESYCMGDKVKVKLKDNQIFKGPISSISRDSVITVDGTEIDIQAIQWIMKSKLSTEKAILGSLLTAAGVVTVATFQPDIFSDEIPLQPILGLGLVAIGVVVLTDHSKFKVERGDKMIFKDLHLESPIARN
jgi:multidrug transporter EmrE-like cation transporter